MAIEDGALEQEFAKVVHDLVRPAVDLVVGRQEQSAQALETRLLTLEDLMRARLDELRARVAAGAEVIGGFGEKLISVGDDLEAAERRLVAHLGQGQLDQRANQERLLELLARLTKAQADSGAATTDLLVEVADARAQTMSGLDEVSARRARLTSLLEQDAEHSRRAYAALAEEISSLKTCVLDAEGQLTVRHGEQERRLRGLEGAVTSMTRPLQELTTQEARAEQQFVHWETWSRRTGLQLVLVLVVLVALAGVDLVLLLAR